MDVGVTAAFDFIGSPPFVLEYTEQRQGATRASTCSADFNGYHGEIVLQPDHEGQYTYVSHLTYARLMVQIFTSLSDGKYSKLKLDKPPIKQTAHPLANVDVDTRRLGVAPRQLFACSGEEVEMDLDAKVCKTLL